MSLWQLIVAWIYPGNWLRYSMTNNLNSGKEEIITYLGITVKKKKKT